MKYTPEKLIQFENNVCKLFNEKKIRAPIHLYNGNEKEIIKVFKKVKKNDWIFCSWRSHYQCLLKGVPQKILLKKILNGKSIALTFKKYKIFSSAIVGGNVPVALGTAISLKRKKSKSRVFCFIGDMTSESGIAHESIKYAINYNLPIQFIIEDNNLSVCTDTLKTWKMKKLTFSNKKTKFIYYYKYKNKYPHAGSGKRIQF